MTWPQRKCETDDVLYPGVWNKGICAASCCTIAHSGHIVAKARMYLKLRGENPFISGKAALRSLPSSWLSKNLAARSSTSSATRFWCQLYSRW